MKGGEWTLEPGFVLRDPILDGTLQLIWLGLPGVHALSAQREQDERRLAGERAVCFLNLNSPFTLVMQLPDVRSIV